MLLCGIVRGTVRSSKIHHGHFFLSQKQFIFLINFVKRNELGHRHSFHSKFPSQGLKLETVLIAKVELLLMFLMNYHENNSLNFLCGEGGLDGIEQSDLIFVSGVVNLMVLNTMFLPQCG